MQRDSPPRKCEANETQSEKESVCRRLGRCSNDWISRQIVSRHARNPQAGSAKVAGIEKARR
jgi:hypothetical protein